LQKKKHAGRATFCAPSRAVRVAADNTDLDLKDDVRLGAAAQQFVGDGQVLLHRNRGTVPHVRLEQWELTVLHAFLGDGQQRTDEAVQLVLGTVIGVEGDVDGIILRDLLGEGCEGRGTSNLVLDRRTREVLGTAGGNLDDAIGPGFGEALQSGIQRLGRADIDGRVGKLALLGPVDHLGIDLRGCNWHGASFPCWN